MRTARNSGSMGMPNLVRQGLENCQRYFSQLVWGRLTKNERLRETGILAGEAMVDVLGLQYAVQYSTGRLNPVQSSYRNSFFQGGTSFPSGALPDPTRPIQLPGSRPWHNTRGRCATPDLQCVFSLQGFVFVRKSFPPPGVRRTHIPSQTSLSTRRSCALDLSLMHPPHFRTNIIAALTLLLLLVSTVEAQTPTD